MVAAQGMSCGASVRPVGPFRLTGMLVTLEPIGKLASGDVHLHLLGVEENWGVVVHLGHIYDT